MYVINIYNKVLTRNLKKIINFIGRGVNILELVFFYINQTSTKFIEKKGFNFSANYSFYVEHIDGKYVLKQNVCKKILPSNFFDEQECITNITAIVGENGTGKTTLLSKLSNFHFGEKKKKPNPGYDDYYAQKYEEDKIIAIYLEEAKLVCYHNIDNFMNETGVRVAEGVRDRKAYENISKICISNSMYSLEDGIFTDGKISKILLNVNSLKTLKSIFYKRKCNRKNSCVGGYYEIQDIVCNAKREKEFQQILDVLYLQYIKENNIGSIFVNNIVDTFEIKFQWVYKYVEDRYNRVGTEKDKEDSLKNYFNLLNKNIFSNFPFELMKTDIFVVIYINLLSELMAYCKVDNPVAEQSIYDKEDLVNYILNIINELLQREDRYALLFQEDFEEIQEYESVLNDCRMYSCPLPVSDLAYVSYKEVKYGDEAYEQILALIKKSVFEREHSYVLKYIDIGGWQLASGERALLNFFSWIHLVTCFNYISDDVRYSLHENVLLLIDEIDLYCHPLWQQKLIYYLIEEIKAEYSDKKIQIIFTTHSPIVLSDMPHSNVIFLKRENNKCNVEQYSNHEETFGANIYKLFNDAFFLGEKGQIGEFARRKIQSIIDKIRPDTSDKDNVSYPSLTEDEACLLEQQIGLVGEKIIQDKLYEMLYKCKYNSLDLRQRKIKIYEEKIKRLQKEEDR